MTSHEWKTHNSDGGNRVVVTKNLPGDRWLRILTWADCRVEICTSTDALSVAEIKAAIGKRCDAVIGQLTEDWGDALFAALKAAGGRAYGNYAVGYNNVDVAAATRRGIAVGNTPGVLTETTAEMALALTFAAARRTGESERFLRAGKYRGWLPTLFLGKLLYGRTVGIVGAGRIGAAYGRMMVEGHKMHLKYYDLYPNPDLEACIKDYAGFLKARGETPVSCTRSDTLEDLLKTADCVSLHTVLDQSSHHLINAERLSLMKTDAVLINTSRGPIIDEAALVAHCRAHPDFRAGLDVFEDEPALKPGLNELENVVLVPHIGSATSWTREGMAILAAANVAGILMGFPVWQQTDITPFLKEDPPRAAPSIINAPDLNLTG
ncbi:MAG: D-glycerate dehydrogenase [Deltaproteobacteria bacterium]|nr:D-glycerate dehydrogenase [Deltaproteobacteria bacterium]